MAYLTIINSYALVESGPGLLVVTWGYLGGFTVSGLILFVNDSGANPKGHHLACMIAAWC